MYISELAVKEINAYYARRGGRRTAVVKNFACYMEKAAQTERTGGSKESARPAEDASKEKANVSSSSSAENAASCCEKCRLTDQLILRMMNLYTQSGSLYSGAGPGYSASTAKALAAYRSLSGYSDLFS